MGLIDLIGPAHIDDRKAISRRVVKIPLENDAHALAKNGIDEATSAFEKVDNVNKLYFEKYNENIIGKYLDEKANINGEVFGSIIEQNLIDSAAQSEFNIFFEKGANYNPLMIPKINYQVNAQMENPFKSDGNGSGEFYVWEVNKLQNNQIVTIQDDDTGPISGYIHNISGTVPFKITLYDINTLAALNISAYTMDQNARIIGVKNPYSELDIIPYIKEIYDIMMSGYAGGINSVGTYTYATKQLVVTTNTWAVGQLLIGDDGATEGAVLEIISAPAGMGPTYTYSVREIASTSNDVTATWIANFGGFSNGERQNLSGSSYDNALNALADKSIDLIYDGTENWEKYLLLQQSNISLNEEIINARITQNNIALLDVNNALLIINNWELLPNTGVGGKFVDGVFNLIDAEMTARIAFTTPRMAQIDTFLGGIVDNLDGTFDPLGTNQDALYINYDLMNKRINRVFGSLTKYIRNASSSNNLQQLTDINEDFSDISSGIPGSGLYDNDIIAKIFYKDGQDSNIIEIEDPTGFAVNDSVFVVSETQSELPANSIPGSIIAITPKTIVSNGVIVTTYLVTLSFNIPSTYLKLDLARLYKLL